MKQVTKGAGGMSEEAKDSGFQVVPVESTSEYMKHCYLRGYVGDLQFEQILTLLHVFV